jgi:hypothetical protein
LGALFLKKKIGYHTLFWVYTTNQIINKKNCGVQYLYIGTQSQSFFGSNPFENKRMPNIVFRVLFSHHFFRSFNAVRCNTCARQITLTGIITHFWSSIRFNEDFKQSLDWLSLINTCHLLSSSLFLSFYFVPYLSRPKKQERKETNTWGYKKMNGKKENYANLKEIRKRKNHI